MRGGAAPSIRAVGADSYAAGAAGGRAKAGSLSDDSRSGAATSMASAAGGAYCGSGSGSTSLSALAGLRRAASHGEQNGPSNTNLT